jgi:hypothetical protein
MENEEIKVTEDITIDENNQLEVDEIQDYAEEVE